MAVARKKVGPTAATAEKVSTAGCANSLNPTTQLKLGSEHAENHQIIGTFSQMQKWRSHIKSCDYKIPNMTTEKKN